MRNFSGNLPVFFQKKVYLFCLNFIISFKLNNIKSTDIIPQNNWSLGLLYIPVFQMFCQTTPTSPVWVAMVINSSLMPKLSSFTLEIKEIRIILWIRNYHINNTWNWITSRTYLVFQLCTQKNRKVSSSTTNSSFIQ